MRATTRRLTTNTYCFVMGVATSNLALLLVIAILDLTPATAEYAGFDTDRSEQSIKAPLNALAFGSILLGIVLVYGAVSYYLLGYIGL